MPTVEGVETVRGSVGTADLGQVLMHEHVFVLGAEIRGTTRFSESMGRGGARCRRGRQVEAMQGARHRHHRRPQRDRTRRYIPRIQRINEQVDINIIVATGLYAYNDVPFQFRPGLIFDTPEPLVGLFVKDIREGIADTGVKAAFLKCAIEKPGLTPGVERVMRAVGQAHVETDVPITVHTNLHTRSGLVAQKVQAEEGVDLTKVVIGHSGDSTDLDYLCKLADAGSYLGMDRLGLDVLCPFEDRVDTVAELVRRGYAEKVVLAHDAACFIDWFSR